MSDENWHAIESDPDVFTELIRRLGIQGVQMEDIYTLDDKHRLEELHPIYGIILGFKLPINKASFPEQKVNLQKDAPVYFAKESNIVRDASSATISLINLAMNASRLVGTGATFLVGDFLHDIYKVTSDCNPAIKGLVIGGKQKLRELHNSLAKSKGGGDVWRFITYVPVDGKIYELDGLKEGPIFLANMEQGKEWVDVAIPFINRRIQKYTAAKIQCNLLGFVLHKNLRKIDELKKLAIEHMPETFAPTELLFVDLMINDNAPIQALVDSGSCFCILSREYAEKLNIIEKMDPRALLFNQITAVVTAGPLRGPPGILDLTSLPKESPIIFCGSLGRELWSSETSSTNYPGGNAHVLKQFSNEMDNLLENQEFSKFGLIGSGVQRKVDRLTMSVQTVGKHIDPGLSAKYQNEIRERLRRIDPNGESLSLVTTSAEMEVILHSGFRWNKGDGIAHLMQAIEDNLDTGHLLICGNTHADLPMVQKAKLQNKTGVKALFVTTNQGVKQQVIHNVGDVNRCCFVSSPDVIHAAMMSILATQSAEERST